MKYPPELTASGYPLGSEADEAYNRGLTASLRGVKEAIPMRLAPRDGRRVLVKTHLFKYSGTYEGWVKSGTAWVECWYDPTHRGGQNPRWREWCGNYQTTSTSHIDPIAWLPHPEGDEVRKDPA